MTRPTAELVVIIKLALAPLSTNLPCSTNFFAIRSLSVLQPIAACSAFGCCLWHSVDYSGIDIYIHYFFTYRYMYRYAIAFPGSELHLFCLRWSGCFWLLPVVCWRSRFDEMIHELDVGAMSFSLLDWMVSVLWWGGAC